MANGKKITIGFIPLHLRKIRSPKLFRHFGIVTPNPISIIPEFRRDVAKYQNSRQPLPVASLGALLVVPTGVS